MSSHFPKNIIDRVQPLTPSLSQLYWELRYLLGGTSGPGSSGDFARFKASVLNTFVQENDITSVIEFGCGDGVQLELASYPQYIGLDVSRQAIQRCRGRFTADPTKSFFVYDPACFVDNHGLFEAELTLSLDVIYHLLNDEVFDLYMRHLFSSSEQFVAIYSSNCQKRSFALHVRHRPFTKWIESNTSEWHLMRTISNEHSPSTHSNAGIPYDFFIYEKATRTTDAVGASRQH